MSRNGLSSFKSGHQWEYLIFMCYINTKITLAGPSYLSANSHRCFITVYLLDLSFQSYQDLVLIMVVGICLLLGQSRFITYFLCSASFVSTVNEEAIPFSFFVGVCFVLLFVLRMTPKVLLFNKELFKAKEGVS